MSDAVVQDASAENWEETPAAGFVEQIPVVQQAELPDIKLFGKWSCDDVQVSDMSLQVRILISRTQQRIP
jgi:small subunit ribosomal protein S5e